MATVLNVRSATDNLLPRVKPTPQGPLTQIYHPSADGTDENLLVLLHGLGDTHISFSKLGKQLRLPQTATLSLRAPERVPYLYEEAYQWYESFDTLGELLPRPNPARALEVLEKTLNHLITECGWPPNRVHLFGFGQGGGLAAELGLRWWKTGNRKNPESPLASIVNVAGPLLSYPTPTSPSPTPILIFHRSESEIAKLSSTDLKALTKGFQNVREEKGAKGEGMPRSKEEWQGIMQFWSGLLARRNDGMYEVLGG